MITYKCEHGHVFFENEMVQVRVMEGEYLRERYVCPDCGTEDFEEARPCSECGDYFTETELEDNLCEKCRDAVNDEHFLVLSKATDGSMRATTGMKERVYLHERKKLF